MYPWPEESDIVNVSPNSEPKVNVAIRQEARVVNVNCGIRLLITLRLFPGLPLCFDEEWTIRPLFNNPGTPAMESGRAPARTGNLVLVRHAL